jgi:DNA-directed RNA polymerase subunit RPC12/RpoP
VIQKFTHLEALRIKAVALGVALASWLLPVSAGLLVEESLRPWAIGGLVLGSVCLGLSVVLAWPLYCPWCANRLFFVVPIANSPGPSQLRRQFLPHEIVVEGRMMCPHCRSRFALPGRKTAPISGPAEPT